MTERSGVGFDRKTNSHGSAPSWSETLRGDGAAIRSDEYLCNPQAKTETGNGTKLPAAAKCPFEHLGGLVRHKSHPFIRDRNDEFSGIGADQDRDGGFGRGILAGIFDDLPDRLLDQTRI